MQYFCLMLSEKEKNFVTWWGQEREKPVSFPMQLISGLPMAILFCIPVLLLITAVYLFLPEWYTRISNSLSGYMTTIVIAVIICILFFSYFRMQYKRELNEQLYRELKIKENKTE
jgi:hypothetical protein